MPDKTGDNIVLFVAAGCGLGYSPFLPGTIGSLLGLALAWALQQSGLPLALWPAVVGLLFIIGIPVCGRAARRLGRSDPPSVVFDEIAAVPLVFLAVPWNLTTAVAGFLWFRLFDIVKPWPIHRLERLEGGLGIMIDDILAALYAAGSLWLTVRGLELLRPP